MTQQTVDTPRRKRGSETAADMARSLGLVVLVVVVLLLIGPGRYLVFPSHRDRAVPPDFTSVLSQAGLVVGHPVAAPSPLPADWVPNAARVSGKAGTVALHVGFVTPAKEYVALDEAQRPVADWVASVLDGPASAVGASAVDGWTTWRTKDGKDALVRELRGLVVVVSGTSRPDVVRLAASVR